MEIERKRGDTYADKFTVTNKKTRAVVNLAGCSFKLTVDIRMNPSDSSTQVYQLTGVINDPTTGVVEFAPTALQADIVGLYYYDIQMTDGQGYIRTLTSDVYKYVQDITK